MADAYDMAAQTYALNYTRDEIKVQKLITASLNMIQRMALYTRKIISQEAPPENQLNKLLYDIKRNKQFFRIQDDYWETIKRLQEKVSYNLTKTEYDYINQQIDSEMSLEIFKSSMGLKI